MAALFAAYAAFSGVQTQIALQRKAFNLSQADAIAVRLGRLADLQLAARRLQERIDIELQAPYVMGIFPAKDVAARDKQIQTHKAALEGAMADATAFETAVVRAPIRPETQRVADGYMSAIRDMEYALTIALGDLKDNATIDARSKPQLGEAFGKVRTAFEALKQLVEFEVETLKRRHDSLVEESN